MPKTPRNQSVYRIPLKGECGMRNRIPKPHVRNQCGLNAEYGMQPQKWRKSLLNKKHQKAAKTFLSTLFAKEPK